MAAIQLAQRCGAEVFATASPSKWEALRELGVAEDHIASSRDLEFEQRFLEQTGGEGVDVVLNSLAGEFIDASLRAAAARRALPRDGQDGHARRRAGGGRAPGVSYRAYDLSEMGLGRMREMLTEIVGLFEPACFATPRSRAGTCATLPRPSATCARAETSARSCSRSRGRSIPIAPF